jgi:hypothetical protein
MLLEEAVKKEETSGRVEPTNAPNYFRLKHTIVRALSCSPPTGDTIGSMGAIHSYTLARNKVQLVRTLS